MEVMDKLGLQWTPDVEGGQKEEKGPPAGRWPQATTANAATGGSRPKPSGAGASRPARGGGDSGVSGIGRWDEVDGGDPDAMDFVAAVSGDQSAEGEGGGARADGSVISSPGGNLESSPGSLDRSGGSRGRSPVGGRDGRSSASRSPPSRPGFPNTSPRASQQPRSPLGFDSEARELFQRPQTAGPTRSVRPHSPSSTRGLVPRPGSATVQRVPSGGSLARPFGGPPPVSLGRHEVEVKALRVDERDDVAVRGAMGVSAMEGEFKRSMQMLSSISESKAQSHVAAAAWQAAQEQEQLAPGSGGTALQHALGVHATDFTPPRGYQPERSAVFQPSHPASQHPFPQRPGGTIRPASAMGRVESHQQHDFPPRPRSALRSGPLASRTGAQQQQQRPSTAHPHVHHPVARQSIRPPQRVRPYTALAMRSLDQRLSAASQHAVEDDASMMMIASVIPKQDPAKQRITRPRSAYSAAARQKEEERRQMNVRALELEAHGLDRAGSTTSSVSIGGVVEMDEVFATSRAGKVVRLLLGHKPQKGAAKQEPDWFRHKPRKVGEARSGVLSMSHAVTSDVKAISMNIGSRPKTPIEAHRHGLAPSSSSAAKPQAPRPKLSDTWRVKPVPMQHNNNTPSQSLSMMGRNSSSGLPDPSPEVHVERQHRATYVPGGARQQQQQQAQGRAAVTALATDTIEQGVVTGWEEPGDGSLYSPIRMLASPDSRAGDSPQEADTSL